MQVLRIEIFLVPQLSLFYKAVTRSFADFQSLRKKSHSTFESAHSCNVKAFSHNLEELFNELDHIDACAQTYDKLSIYADAKNNG